MNKRTRSSVGSGELAAALSPDGRWLALVSSKYNPKEDRFKSGAVVQLWEVASGTLREWFKTEVGVELQSVAWSPNGSLLVAGDSKGDLWFWDVEDKQFSRHITGHRGGVKQLVFSQDGHRLASRSSDITALVWDLQKLDLVKPAHEEAKVNPKLPSKDDLWSALADPEAAKAWPAMQILTKNPDTAIPLLRVRLRPATLTDPKKAAKLLAELDDDNIQIRSRAETELAKMGPVIEPVLREALAKKPSVEVSARIKRLLKMKEINPALLNGLSLKELQIYRGMEVLERIGTPAARQVLEELSQLPASLVQVEDAKAALQRMQPK